MLKIHALSEQAYNRKYISTVFCIHSSVETCMVCIRLLSLTKTMENRVALLSLTATLYVCIMTCANSISFDQLVKTRNYVHKLSQIQS